MDRMLLHHGICVSQCPVGKGLHAEHGAGGIGGVCVGRSLQKPTGAPKPELPTDAPSRAMVGMFFGVAAVAGLVWGVKTGRISSESLPSFNFGGGAKYRRVKYEDDLAYEYETYELHMAEHSDDDDDVRGRAPDDLASAEADADAILRSIGREGTAVPSPLSPPKSGSGGGRAPPVTGPGSVKIRAD